MEHKVYKILSGLTVIECFILWVSGYINLLYFVVFASCVLALLITMSVKKEHYVLRKKKQKRSNNVKKHHTYQKESILLTNRLNEISKKDDDPLGWPTRQKIWNTRIPKALYNADKYKNHLMYRFKKCSKHI